jgi:hypothetical protein
MARFIYAASACERPAVTDWQSGREHLQATILFLLLASRSAVTRPLVVLGRTCSCATGVYSASGSVIHTRGRRWPRCAANRDSQACDCRGVTHRARGCSASDRGRDDT